MNKKIIGHTKQIDLLQNAIQNRGHQSFLFFGPESVGKYTVARAFAQNIILQNDDCVWEVCDGVESDISVVVPEQEKKKDKIVVKDISVDQIKEGMRFLMLTSDTGARVLIIDDAHRMTTTAQNALLKTLEEPQKDKYIVLVTDSSQQMLQTIHSRCFHIQFNVVEDEQLQELFENDEYVSDVGGRPGYLVRMHEDEEFRSVVEYARNQLQSFFTKKVYERMQLATELSKYDDEYIQLFLQVWIYRIRNAAHKVQKFTLIKTADDVEDVLHKLQSTNVNKKIALENLFVNMV
jgi:DNA polymerase-3 subunit delta'